MNYPRIMISLFLCFSIFIMLPVLEATGASSGDDFMLRTLPTKIAMEKSLQKLQAASLDFRKNPNDVKNRVVLKNALKDAIAKANGLTKQAQGEKKESIILLKATKRLLDDLESALSIITSPGMSKSQENSLGAKLNSIDIQKTSFGLLEPKAEP